MMSPECEALRQDRDAADSLARALRADVQRLTADNERLRAGIERLILKHLQVEDSYYSCPFGLPGEECECGVSDHNAKIDALLAEPPASAAGSSGDADAVRRAADELASAMVGLVNHYERHATHRCEIDRDARNALIAYREAVGRGKGEA